MKPTERDRLHALLSALVDGTIGEEQAAELVRTLESDAEARRFYIRYLDMHAALAAAASRPAAPGRGRFPWVAVIATLLAASVLLAWLASPADRSGDIALPTDASVAMAAGAAASDYVATIASASEDMALNGEPVFAGRRLTPGPYVVTAGSVMIQLDGGAHIWFDAGARFSLRSRRALTIERGTFVFEGDQSCESIEITTPHSVFRDIGTRYAAVVGAHEEEVHVAEGAVRRTTGEGPRPRRHELIEAGAGRRYAAEPAVTESIPLDEALVARSLAAGPARAGIVPPTVVDGFQGGRGPVAGLRSGRGWAEPWRSRRGALEVISPGLAGAGSFAVRHDGSGAEAAGQLAAAHRRLAEPIDLSRDGISYLRFLVRRGPAPANDEHRAMVVLRAHGVSPRDEVERSTLIQIALRRDDKAMVRVADTLTRAALPQVPGQAYVVIAKIVAGRSEPDQVLIRLMTVDQFADSEEPADWSFVSESVHTDMRIDQVSLECVSGGRLEFGDLCIGPTWECVTRPLAGR